MKGHSPVLVLAPECLAHARTPPRQTKHTHTRNECSSFFVCRNMPSRDAPRGRSFLRNTARYPAAVASRYPVRSPGALSMSPSRYNGVLT